MEDVMRINESQQKVDPEICELADEDLEGIAAGGGIDEPKSLQIVNFGSDETPPPEPLDPLFDYLSHLTS